MVSLYPTVAKLVNIEIQEHRIGIRSLGQSYFSSDQSLGSPLKPDAFCVVQLPSRGSQAFRNNKTALVSYNLSSPILSSWQSLASPWRPDTCCVSQWPSPCSQTRRSNKTALVSDHLDNHLEAFGSQIPSIWAQCRLI